MRIDPILSGTVADLLVNLSAGYFGTALLSPSLSRRKGVTRIVFLTNYIVGGIVLLILAYALRKTV